MAENKKKKVLIWYEAGTVNGHHKVVSQLCRKLSEKGCDVKVLTGSATSRMKHFDFGNAEIVPLPGFTEPSTASVHNSTLGLLTSNGQDILEDTKWHKEREKTILKTFEDFNPDAVVFEVWPFARHSFTQELTALTNRIHQLTSPPPCYSICRDIMFDKLASGYNKQSVLHQLEKYIDGGVIIRGDENIIPFQNYWGNIPKGLSDKLHYSGYFVEPPPPDHAYNPDGSIVVTSGGAATAESFDMFAAAIKASQQTELAKQKKWQIVVPFAPDSNEFTKLKRSIVRKDGTHLDNVSIMPNMPRPAFKKLLEGAAIVISHGGMTLPETVALGIKNIVIPRFLRGRNREQSIRAERFSQLPRSGVIIADIAKHHGNHTECANILTEALTKIQHKQCTIKFKLDGANDAAEFISQAKKITAPLLPEHAINPARISNRPTITLLVGPPGIGKSTWLDNNLEKLGDNLPVLSTDEVLEHYAQKNRITYQQAHQAFFEEAVSEFEENIKHHIYGKQSFVIDRTNMNIMGRKRLLTPLGNEWLKVGICFEYDKKTVVERLERREKKTGKNIPETAVQTIIDNSKPPGKEFDIIITIDKTGHYKSAKATSYIGAAYLKNYQDMFLYKQHPHSPSWTM